MRKSSTFLFALFLTTVLVFLVSINFLKDFSYLGKLNSYAIPSISILAIIVVIMTFIFREIENNRIQNEFIAIVTHKFKTPLTGVRWTIDMLQKDLTLLEKKDLLIEMQKANERLMEIVDLLVSFADFDKRLEYKFEEVSLKEIADISAAKYLAATKNKNIRMSVDNSKNIPKVMADKPKIQFVVDMLIDNAIKYTPKEGAIFVSFNVDNKSVSLNVNDTGIGMGFFEKRKIFKHFFRASNAKLMDTDGLGLGLYTAKEIVCHHKGGKIWAESEGLNRGSTFSIQLPIRR